MRLAVKIHENCEELCVRNIGDVRSQSALRRDGSKASFFACDKTPDRKRSSMDHSVKLAIT